MLSTKSLILLRLNRLCVNRGLTSCCSQLVQINIPKSNRFENVNQTNKTLTLNLIGLRHYSDGKTKKPNKEPDLKLQFVDDMPRLTHTERLKRIIQNYGMTAVVLHVALSLTSLGIWYSIIYFGVDLPAHFDFDRFGQMGSKVMASSGTFAVAYAIHKMTMPGRVALTVVSTPILVNWLRKKGFIKKPHKHI